MCIEILLKVGRREENSEGGKFMSRRGDISSFFQLLYETPE